MLLLKNPPLEFHGSISTHTLYHNAVGLRVESQTWRLLLLLLQRLLYLILLQTRHVLNMSSNLFKWQHLDYFLFNQRVCLDLRWLYH